MNRCLTALVLVIATVIGAFCNALAINRINLSQAQASFISEPGSPVESVSMVGDVNGDGYGDFLVAAPSYDLRQEEDVGQTYLIFGKPDGWQMNTDLSAADASFIGEYKWDSGDGSISGYIISGAGDVNGDGYDDILIGATANDEGGGDPENKYDGAGQSYLIFGKPDGWRMRTKLSQADASFIGEGELNGAGYVSGAGDVNGDGYDDILIGAPGNSDGGQHAGKTYLIFGKPSGWQMDMPLSEADASFIGEDSPNISGSSIAGAGDINGDGYDDILIGAVWYGNGGDFVGQTYLIFGQPSGWEMDMSLSEANASFIGEYSGDESGISVSGAGDVNGDGYDDILVGAAYNNDGGKYAGQTYLIFGRPSGWAMRTPLSAGDASFIGEDEWDLSGFSVSGSGDINGDGYDDFLIGAHGNDLGANNAGQTYLIFGQPEGWRMRTNLSDVSLSFYGEEEYLQLGTSVSGASDVNGDAFSDILIRAFDGGEDGAGQAFLWLHLPLTIVTTTLPDGAVCIPYNEVLLAAGGAPPYSWRLSSGSLPPGLSLEATGFISGIPTALDTANFTMEVSDSLSNIYTQGFTITIYYEAPIITTVSLPSGAVGIPYSETFSAKRGVPPYTWRLYSGSLPEGLSLDATGVISGIPTVLDTANFTVEVADSLFTTSTKYFTIIITEATKGDVNGDGQINILDVVFAVNIILELYDPTPTQFWAADCNEDEIINIVDVIGLVNVILDIGTCPP